MARKGEAADHEKKIFDKAMRKTGGNKLESLDDLLEETNDGTDRRCRAAATTEWLANIFRNDLKTQKSPEEREKTIHTIATLKVFANLMRKENIEKKLSVSKGTNDGESQNIMPVIPQNSTVDKKQAKDMPQKRLSNGERSHARGTTKTEILIASHAMKKSHGKPFAGIDAVLARSGPAPIEKGKI